MTPKLQCKHLLDYSNFIRKAEKSSFVSFPVYIIILMVGGNLGMIGIGVPAARQEVRLPNTWTHLDIQMP